MRPRRSRFLIGPLAMDRGLARAAAASAASVAPALTALTPSVSAAATYLVTVTTPAGTSAYGPFFTFS